MKLSEHNIQNMCKHILKPCFLIRYEKRDLSVNFCCIYKKETAKTFSYRTQIASNFTCISFNLINLNPIEDIAKSVL